VCSGSTTSCGWGAAGWGGSSRGGSSSASGTTGRATSSSSKLGVNESKRLLAVLGSVALMGVGVVSVAAVWVGCVAVRLDPGCVGALEASWTGCELEVKNHVSVSA